MGLQKLGKAGLDEAVLQSLQSASIRTLGDLRMARPEALEKAVGRTQAERIRGLLELWDRRRALQRKPRRVFERYPAYKQSKLKLTWRRPRGLHNKVRGHRKGKPPRVMPGYGTPRVLRHYHPSGLRESLVLRPEEVAGLPPGTALRVGSTVGLKKRLEIEERAAASGLRVLNPVRRG